MGKRNMLSDVGDLSPSAEKLTMQQSKEQKEQQHRKSHCNRYSPKDQHITRAQRFQAPPTLSPIVVCIQCILPGPFLHEVFVRINWWRYEHHDLRRVRILRERLRGNSVRSTLALPDARHFNSFKSRTRN